jgi:Rrf2 family protein
MITKKTEYAFRILWELSQADNDRVTSGTIAQRQSIPAKYLPQIVSELTRSGLVSSARGFGGGLRLGRESESITLLDVIEAMQGKMHLFECQANPADCLASPDCNLRQVYAQAQDALEAVFASTKLSELKLGKVLPRDRT